MKPKVRFIHGKYYCMVQKAIGVGKVQLTPTNSLNLLSVNHNDERGNLYMFAGSTDTQYALDYRGNTITFTEWAQL